MEIPLMATCIMEKFVSTTARFSPEFDTPRSPA